MQYRFPTSFHRNLSLTGLLAATLMLMNVWSSPQARAQAGEKEVSLIIYIDQSASMAHKKDLVIKMMGRVVDQLDKACGKYRIAISQIGYWGWSKSPYIVGEPKFITEKHGTPGIKILEDRVQTVASETLSSPSEKLHSTIALSIEREHQELVTSDLVAALLISDAVPSAEDYTAEEALQRIHSFIPDKKFLAVGIIPQYLEHAKDPQCQIDEYPKAIRRLSEEELSQPHQFFRKSGGYTTDICYKNFEAQLDEFLHYVISSANCMLLM